MSKVLSDGAFPNSRLYGLTKGMTEMQSSPRGTLAFLTPLRSDLVNRTRMGTQLSLLFCQQPARILARSSKPMPNRNQIGLIRNVILPALGGFFLQTSRDIMIM